MLYADAAAISQRRQHDIMLAPARHQKLLPGARISYLRRRARDAMTCRHCHAEQQQ